MLPFITGGNNESYLRHLKRRVCCYHDTVYPSELKWCTYPQGFTLKNSQMKNDKTEERYPRIVYFLIFNIEYHNNNSCLFILVTYPLIKGLGNTLFVISSSNWSENKRTQLERQFEFRFFLFYLMS